MLKAFLTSLPDDAARREWAISCGTTLGHLRNCIYAPKSPAPETCVLIERNSGGKVRRWHTRPADWARIWPELIGVHEAPIVDDQHQTVSTARVTPAGAYPADAGSVARAQFQHPATTQQAARDAA
jgi:hypothetical protein